MSHISRFIELYEDWFLDSTDAPYVFCEASALMCLSTISLGRRWISGADRINSNLYMMLVGPSSRARKSTSIKRAREVIEEVDPGRVGPTDYTAEGLFKWMQEKDEETKKSRTRLTLFGSEFAADLARSAGYKNSFRDDLTNLYDGYDIEKTRAGFGKNITIASPRVSLFAAVTYEGLRANTTGTDWHTGFLMRFLFVTPIEWRELRVHTAPADPIRKQNAAQALYMLREELRANVGGLQLSQEAMQCYGDAYQRHMDSMLVSKHDHTRETPQEVYMQRFWPNVKKLALLYQIDDDPHAEISAAAMQRALNFAANCWQGYTQAQRETTIGDFGTLCTVVLEAITNAGPSGLPISQLSGYLGHSQQLANVLKYIEVTNLVRRRVDGPTGTIWFIKR